MPFLTIIIIMIIILSLQQQCVLDAFAISLCPEHIYGRKREKKERNTCYYTWMVPLANIIYNHRISTTRNKTLGHAAMKQNE
jgi:hypothetical protein